MTREQAADEFANTHQRNYMLTEKEDYKVSLKMAYLRGCIDTDQEHKEFYLAVAEIMGDKPKNQPEINRLTKIIDYHIAAFAERQREYEYFIKFIEDENNKRSHEH